MQSRNGIEEKESQETEKQKRKNEIDRQEGKEWNGERKGEK